MEKSVPLYDSLQSTTHMGKNNVVSNLEFSKWIIASSCHQALTQARSFWDSKEILSSSSGAICFQHILNADKESNTDDIEWFVQSKIECQKDREKDIVKIACKKNWNREDVLNRIVPSSTDG